MNFVAQFYDLVHRDKEKIGEGLYKRRFRVIYNFPTINGCAVTSSAAVDACDVAGVQISGYTYWLTGWRVGGWINVTTDDRHKCFNRYLANGTVLDLD